MNKANTFPNSERNPKRNPKNSPLPNLDGETNSIPSFLNLFPDPRHHDDATLDKRPILYHSEATETSPFKFILSPSVSTSSMVNFPPLEENQAVKRLNQFSGNVPARLDHQTLTDTSSAGSNQFSGEVGAQSEYESPCVFNEQGFTFTEVSAVRASRRKVVCCQFSSDGKLLASGGHDRKTVLWSTDTLKAKSTLEGHSSLITDVRFSPSMPRLATSSWDKTVRVWDADNPGYSLRALTGHSASISSLDFHPNKDDLICSSDVGGEIMYWSINSGSCQRFFKCATTSHVRFQPRLGRYLAAAAENFVAIVDVETQTLRHSLRGHQKQIGYICWDPSGELLASVSEDSVRVWTFGSGSEGDCIHELSCDGYESHSCVFHPYYASLLVLGCYQRLQLWNMNENKIMTVPAHDGLIAGLAVSPVTGLVASASHDNFVKLWK